MLISMIEPFRFPIHGILSRVATQTPDAQLRIKLCGVIYHSSLSWMWLTSPIRRPDLVADIIMHRRIMMKMSKK
jgi:hypothetical protein